MSELDSLSPLHSRASARELARHLSPPRSLRLLSTLAEEGDTPPCDGVLEIEVCLHLDDQAHAERDSRAQEILGMVEVLNYRWYATGRIAGKTAKASDQLFARCRIHFVPRILLEDPEPEDVGTYYTVQLSRAHFPATRWRTEFEVPELISGAAFEERIPPGVRERITVRHLKSRIERFHSLPALDVAARLAGIREIVTGAGAFLELEGEIDETWSVDTFVSEGDYPSAQSRIEGAVQHYREAKSDDYPERIARLDQVWALLEAYREPTQLRHGWRATKHTLEIDGALVSFDDLPPAAYRDRIDALGKFRSACANYIAPAQALSRFFHRGQHALIPAVEVLEQRAHTKQGEIAVSCGIAAMKPRIEAKRDELALLDAMRFLKLRAMSVQSGLVAQRNSRTLLVEYEEDAAASTALCEAFSACYPAMMGIDKSIDALAGDDLLPLVRLLIPEDTEVHPFA